mgnify:CR=1 FL=1
MQTKLDFLIERVQKQNPQANIKKIRAAYECAAKAHEGQKRRNGEPYIIHPVAVAEIVVEMGLDTDSICAALLHDCIEDTEFGYKEIENKFGTPVAELVDGVTRLGMLRYSKEQEQFEDLRKMFLAMAKDIRVILIKIADRLHNARTFQFLPERKQRDKALETMEIYAPIAHRLGMSRIKWELEDLSLKILDPIGYNEIVEGLKAQSEQHEEFLKGIQERISEKLREAHINNTISARVKHIYSIYRKMYAQHKTINEIYDICAVRVIVDTVADCYNVLGYVHDLYKPIPGRFKDYISTPKPNGYQSLHTTVIGRAGIPFEIPPRIPPQWFVFVTIFPFSTQNGSLFSLPRSRAAAKPAPNRSLRASGPFSLKNTRYLPRAGRLFTASATSAVPASTRMPFCSTYRLPSGAAPSCTRQASSRRKLGWQAS